jgi:hypothetical protein
MRPSRRLDSQHILHGRLEDDHFRPKLEIETFCFLWVKVGDHRPMLNRIVIQVGVDFTLGSSCGRIPAAHISES